MVFKVMVFYYWCLLNHAVPSFSMGAMPFTCNATIATFVHVNFCL